MHKSSSFSLILGIVVVFFLKLSATFANTNQLQTAWPEIKLKASLGSSGTTTSVKFNESMKLGLDFGYDAGMMKSGFDIYTRLVDDNGIDFGIQCLPMPSNVEMLIPIGLESTLGGTVSLSVELNQMPDNCRMIFEDRTLGTFKTISGNETLVSINIPAISKITDRFFLRVTFVFPIAKPILEVTANSISRMYGEENPELSLSYSGFIDSDNENNLDVKPFASTYASKLSKTGNYEILVSGGSDTKYDFVYVSGILSIAKAPLKVNVGDVFSRVGIIPDFNISYDGFINGDGIEALELLPVAQTTADAFSLPGEYPITLNGGLAENYELAYADGKLFLEAKLIPDIKWDAPSAISYGVPLDDKQLNATASINGVFDYSPSAGAVLSAGYSKRLVVKFTPSDTINYETVTDSVFINVNKAILTATANSYTITYGDDLPSLTCRLTGFVNGETEASLIFNSGNETNNNGMPSALTTLPKAALASGNGIDAGVYQISVTGGYSSNYSFVCVDGILTVEKALLTVVAENEQMIEGSEVPSFGYQISGFKYSDGENDIDIMPGAVSSVTSSSPIGAYEIVVDGGFDNNYRFEYANGIVQVLPKKMAIVSWANPSDIVYGTKLGADQLNASAIIEGIFEYVPGFGTIMNAGLNQYLTVRFIPANNDYEIVEDTVLINVQKETLIAMANNKTMIKGEDFPELTLHFQGFVNDDNEDCLDQMPILYTSANMFSAAGDYPIIVEGGFDENYNIVHINGVLTIQEGNNVSAYSNNGITVYHNYKEKLLTINNISNRHGSYLLTNISGKILASGNVEVGITTFQTTHLGNGIYLVNIDVGQKNKVFKVMLF